jgi:excisionase family DNA binding protein
MTAILSTAETADLLGLTTARVGQLVKSGKLKAERLGGRTWIFNRRVVERFARRPRPNGRPPNR